MKIDIFPTVMDVQIKNIYKSRNYIRAEQNFIIKKKKTKS